jgi:hypothetical protein
LAGGVADDDHIVAHVGHNGRHVAVAEGIVGFAKLVNIRRHEGSPWLSV